MHTLSRLPCDGLVATERTRDMGMGLPLAARSSCRTPLRGVWRLRRCAAAALWRAQVSTAMPMSPGGAEPDAAFDAVSALQRESGQAFNLFDMSLPEGLPPALRVAQRQVGSTLLQLGRHFGFQESSVANQEEHIVLLLANASSREPGGSGLAALHTRLLLSAPPPQAPTAATRRATSSSRPT